MQSDLPIERVLQQIANLDRAQCVAELKGLPRPKLDFTDDYLDRQSVEGLRHLLMAAVLTARRHPREAG